MRCKIIRLAYVTQYYKVNKSKKKKKFQFYIIVYIYIYLYTIFSQHS